MGAVYLAEHPGIGRRVAVKVLHKNYTRDEHLLARFLNEARAANAIRHPNIIEILDSGMLADGTPFLVMELLEGESLGDAARGRRARCRSRPRSTSPTRPRRRWARRTPRGSSTAISSPTTSSSSPDPHDPRPRADQGARLRHRQAAAGIGGADSVKTRTGHADGDADLHVARAVPRHAGGRSPQRHLLAGRHLLRDAGRAAALRLGGVRRAGQHAPQRAAGVGALEAGGDPAGGRRAGAEDALQEPRGPLRRHGRGAGRAEGVGRAASSRCAGRRPTSAKRAREAAGDADVADGRHDVLDRVRRAHRGGDGPAAAAARRSGMGVVAAAAIAGRRRLWWQSSEAPEADGDQDRRGPARRPAPTPPVDAAAGHAAPPHAAHPVAARPRRWR